MATTTSDIGPPNMNFQGPTVLPSKFQVIVLENENCLTLEDYVKAVAEKVQAINITHVCRTFKNNVAIYLSTTELVEKLTNEHKTLMIKDKEVKLHKMARPVFDIRFNAVPPEIPDLMILAEIHNLGIKSLSLVRGVKANWTDEFSHILTDKRRVCVLLDDNQVIPQSLVIPFDGINYRILLNIIPLHNRFNIYGTDTIFSKLYPNGQIEETISLPGLVGGQVKEEAPDCPSISSEVKGIKRQYSINNPITKESKKKKHEKC